MPWTICTYHTRDTAQDVTEANYRGRPANCVALSRSSDPPSGPRRPGLLDIAGPPPYRAPMSMSQGLPWQQAWLVVQVLQPWTDGCENDERLN